jgi:hypothetical protein
MVKLAIFAALMMLLLSLIPQADLCRRLGNEWHGAYAYAHYDEDIYAAYLNGLILGRARRSDPLVEPQEGRLPPESLFSIQFVTPYILAAVARAIGLSAAQVFLVFPPLLAAMAAFLLFHLLFILTGDGRLSCGGTLFVLCFGALAGRDGKLVTLLHGEVSYAGFPFLRRYQPGFSFLLFFLFVLFVYLTFTRWDRRGMAAAISAALTFALLVFTYFFLWTAALAWLFIAVALWIIARPSEWGKILMRLLPLAAIGGGALVLYGIFLAGIDENSSSAQILEHTRGPDLWRGPELIGAIVLAMLIMIVRRRKVSWDDPLILLTLSFAMLPFAVFNQQILTGLSLQPFHFEIFIVNYVVLLSAVLTLAIQRRITLITWRPLSMPAFILLCSISIYWGMTEMKYTAFRERARNLARDGFVPVTRRLNEVASRNPGEREVVYSPDTYVVADNIGGYAPNSPLWATHMIVIPSLSAQQRQDRFFQYLYYSAITPVQLEQRLRNKGFIETSALFGYERFARHLSSQFRPLNDDEVSEKVREYSDFVRAFDESQATRPMLSYAIVRSDSQFDFSRLDRWYVREETELIGEYQLIRLVSRKRLGIDN